MNNRRDLITGLISFVAAPAIVRVGSLMPVKRYLTEYEYDGLEHVIDVSWGLLPNPLLYDANWF